MMRLKNYSDYAFLDLIFPPKCAACESLISPAEYELALCPSCLKLWNCERQIQIKEIHSGTKNAMQILTVCLYDTRKNAGSVGKALLLRLKSKPLHHAARFIVSEMFEAIRWLPLRADTVITGIPRSRRGIRENGFDQVRLISSGLSELTGFTYLPLLCHTGNTRQKELDYKHRFRNASEAYSLKKKYKSDIIGKNVLLLDDVVTTGATLEASTKVLLESGAARVYCASFAGTVSI